MKTAHIALLAAAGVGAYYLFRGKPESKAPEGWPRVLTADQALKVDALLAKYFVTDETEVPSATTGPKPVLVRGKLGAAAATTLVQRAALSLPQGLSVYLPHDATEAARLGQTPAEISIVLANVTAHPEVVREAEQQNWHLYRASVGDMVRQVIAGAPAA